MGMVSKEKWIAALVREFECERERERQSDEEGILMD